MKHPSAALILAIAATAATAPVGAGQPLGSLLDQLAPAKVPEGSVEVLSWIERDGGQPELVVTLAPKGAVKLVANPGMTVTPVARDGIAWASTAPVSEIDPARDYFPAPPTIRLPFTAEDGKPVEAGVEYAYCLVDYQCLFGEAKISVPTRATQG